MALIYVCEGSDCRKNRLSKQDLVALGGSASEIKWVGCQKVCKGPVVGTDRCGELTWFARMDSAKALEAFGDMMREGHMRKPLEKRRSAKREGKLR